VITPSPEHAPQRVQIFLLHLNVIVFFPFPASNEKRCVRFVYGRGSRRSRPASAALRHDTGKEARAEVPGEQGAKDTDEAAAWWYDFL